MHIIPSLKQIALYTSWAKQPGKGIKDFATEGSSPEFATHLTGVDHPLIDPPADEEDILVTLKNLIQCGMYEFIPGLANATSISIDCLFHSLATKTLTKEVSFADESERIEFRYENLRSMLSTEFPYKAFEAYVFCLGQDIANNVIINYESDYGRLIYLYERRRCFNVLPLIRGIVGDKFYMTEVLRSFPESDETPLLESITRRDDGAYFKFIYGLVLELDDSDLKKLFIKECVKKRQGTRESIISLSAVSCPENLLVLDDFIDPDVIAAELSMISDGLSIAQIACIHGSADVIRLVKSYIARGLVHSSLRDRSVVQGCVRNGSCDALKELIGDDVRMIFEFKLWMYLFPQPQFFAALFHVEQPNTSVIQLAKKLSYILSNMDDDQKQYVQRDILSAELSHRWVLAELLLAGSFEVFKVLSETFLEFDAFLKIALAGYNEQGFYYLYFTKLIEREDQDAVKMLEYVRDMMGNDEHFTTVCCSKLIAAHGYDYAFESASMPCLLYMLRDAGLSISQSLLSDEILHRLTEHIVKQGDEELSLEAIDPSSRLGRVFYYEHEAISFLHLNVKRIFSPLLVKEVKDFRLVKAAIFLRLEKHKVSRSLISIMWLKNPAEAINDLLDLVSEPGVSPDKVYHKLVQIDQKLQHKPYIVEDVRAIIEDFPAHVPTIQLEKLKLS